MALLDLTSPQASILAKVLNGTLAGPDGRTGPDWRTASPELAAVAHALDRLSFATRACLVCGATFEAKNPRRTTCSDRCRQALSRSKRAAPAQAPSDGHAPAVTPIPDPVAPAPPPPATDPAPPSQPDRDGKDPAAALMACRRLLTPSVVSAIGALVDRLPDLDPHAWKYRWAPAANEYLSSGREGLPDDLRQEIEALAADGPGFRHVKLRAIAVGCMLRLPGLAQPIPTDPAAFAEWSGLALLGDHYRQANNPAAVTVTP